MDVIKTSFDKIQEKARQDQVQVELLVAGGEKLSIGFQKKKMDSFESTQTQTAGLRVISGANQGYAFTENLSEESLLRTYQEALNNARTVQSSSREAVSLVKPQKISTLPGLYVEEDVPMEQKIEAARLLEARSLELDSRVQAVPYSGYREGISFKRILNSEGLDQHFKQNYYSIFAGILAKEGESSKMDGDRAVARRFSDLRIEDTIRAGVTKAVSRLGAKKLATGNYPVVIDREQFITVLHMIQSYLSAKEVEAGKSLFQGKLGEKIASEKFHLIDDPFRQDGMASRPFDDEGAPSQKTVVFEAGVLKSFFTNTEYARRLKLPHTAHASRNPSSTLEIAPTNLVVAKGSASLQDLLQRYPKVIHLTEFAGGLHAGFKSSTGDFSMPAEGFIYENGQCVGAVDQFVMSGNVLELLRDIEEVGNEHVAPGHSMICPDVLVKSLSFAGA